MYLRESAEDVYLDKCLFLTVQAQGEKLACCLRELRWYYVTHPVVPFKSSINFQGKFKITWLGKQYVVCVK